MQEIRQQIELLVELQEKDIAISKVMKRISNHPLAIEDLRSAAVRYRSEVEEGKKQLLEMQKLRKEKEIELQTREEDIKKHNMELNSVKSNEAYRALLSEIENGKKERSVLEDEILVLMEKLDGESARVKISENELKAKESDIQLQIAKIDEESKKDTTELERLQAERNEFAKKVPDDILARYDYLRENLDGIAIVNLEGETCGGCHTVLRPQTINDIYKGKDFVICDNCSRIIYKKNGT